MPPERTRGRRPMPKYGAQETARSEIERLQEELLELTAALEAKKDTLAQVIEKHMRKGVGTAEIGRWLVSEDRPGGVSRQNVYKFVTSRRSKQSSKPKIRPKPKRKRPTRT